MMCRLGRITRVLLLVNLVHSIAALDAELSRKVVGGITAKKLEAQVGVADAYLSVQCNSVESTGQELRHLCIHVVIRPLVWAHRTCLTACMFAHARSWSWRRSQIRPPPASRASSSPTATWRRAGPHLSMRGHLAGYCTADCSSLRCTCREQLALAVQPAIFHRSPAQPHQGPDEEGGLGHPRGRDGQRLWPLGGLPTQRR